MPPTLSGPARAAASQCALGRLSCIEDAFFTLQAAGKGDGEPPGAPQLALAMRELLLAYKAPEVQRELPALWQRLANSGPGDPWEPMRELLWPCQSDILRKHGLPATSAGLRCLQNAVQRRICEGDTLLRELTNEALHSLGLKTLEVIPQDLSAEDLLAAIEARAPEAHANVDAAEFFQALGAQGEDAAALLQELCAQRRPVGPVSFGLLKNWRVWETSGLPRGCHVRPPKPPSAVPRLRRPPAEELFKHVLQNEPVVILDALDADGFPPLRDFQDFGYLRHRCAGRHVNVKADSSWDSLGHRVFINDPKVALPLEDYLQMIEEAESTGAQVRFYMGKVRLREELPELAEDIEAATRSPLRLFGECFGPNPRGPHTYFGCGHNTSIVHCDPSENLLVVISGTKTLDLYPPYEADCLYPPVRKVLTSPVPPLTRPDAMPAAVEARYPLYRHARPLRVELSPGEMLYLPAFWWHGVSGGARRNMILNFWCEMHPAKLDPQLPDQGACGVFRALERVPGPVGPGAAGGP